MTKKEIGAVVGTGVVFLLLVGALGFVFAEYTGIGGGFARICRPFTPPRNQLAYYYTAIGGGLGFVIGGVLGHVRAKKTGKQ